MSHSESDFEFTSPKEHLLNVAKLCKAAGCQLVLTPKNDGIDIYTYNDSIAIKLKLPSNLLGQVLTTTPATWSLVPDRLIRPLECLPKDDQVRYTFLTEKATVVSDVNTCSIERYDFKPTKVKDRDLPDVIDVPPDRLHAFLAFVNKEKPETFNISLEKGFLIFSTKRPAWRTAIKVITDVAHFNRTFLCFPIIPALSFLIATYGAAEEKDEEPEFNLRLDTGDTKSPILFSLDSYMGIIELSLSPYNEPEEEKE